MIAPLRTGLTPLGTAIKWTWTALLLTCICFFLYSVGLQFYQAGWASIALMAASVVAMLLLVRVLAFLTTWKHWPDRLR